MEKAAGDTKTDHRTAFKTETELIQEVSRLATPEAAKDMTEELQEIHKRIPGILEPNPRVIKRTVNILGMWRTIDLLQLGRTHDEILARWAVASARWPALIDLLARKPELVKLIGVSEPDGDIDEDLRPLFKDEVVKKVFYDKKFKTPLDTVEIQKLLGGGP